MDITETRQAKLAGLRELADHLARNPELLDTVTATTFYVFHYGDDVGAFARKALMLGTSQKSSAGDWFNVERQFGPLVTLQVSARHEAVCEKVVIDSQEVEVEELDHDLAAIALADVPMRTVTKTIERTEWVCPVLNEAAKS